MKSMDRRPFEWQEIRCISIRLRKRTMLPDTKSHFLGTLARVVVWRQVTSVSENDFWFWFSFCVVLGHHSPPFFLLFAVLC